MNLSSSLTSTTLSISTSLSLLVLFKMMIIKATHLLIFARDETHQQFPIELSSDATLQDLYDEVVRQQQLNTTKGKVVVSLHGQQLYRMDEPLADIGICMQCVVEFRVISFIQMKRKQRSLMRNAFVPPMDDHQDTLYWDPTKDLTQFGWTNSAELDWIAFWFADEHERIVKEIYYQRSERSRSSIKKEIAQSHSFWLVPTEQVEARRPDLMATTEDIKGVDQHYEIEPFDLRTTENARDWIITPTRNQTMFLFARNRDKWQILEYVVPDGFSLFLKHHKEHEYHAVISLQSEEMGIPIDTAYDLQYVVDEGALRLRCLQFMAVSLFGKDGDLQNRVFYKSNTETATSHLFFIRPNEQIRQQSNIGQFASGIGAVHPFDLFDTVYAKDMALVAGDEETLYLHCWSGDSLRLSEYRIPDGYGLWLKYGNPSSVPLRLHAVVASSVLWFNLDADFVQLTRPYPPTIMDSFGVWLCDGDRKQIIYFQTGGDRADSHLFRIQTTKQVVNETVNAFKGENETLYPTDLRKREYAKDLVVTPKHGQTLRLFYWSTRIVSEFSLPGGYSIWLQYASHGSRILTLQ